MVYERAAQTLAKRRVFAAAKLARASPGVNEMPPRKAAAIDTAKRVAMPSRLELCRADEVAEGAALKVEKEGLTLAVFNVDGEYYVLDDACTHGPGSLSEGYIEGDVVECNFHNGQFNIRTGEVVLPPCMIPMKTYPTTLEDGKVFIEV
jgi:nitrite reductase/ring-hydroxylating ferredoxin subunit